MTKPGSPSNGSSLGPEAIVGPEFGEPVSATLLPLTILEMVLERSGSWGVTELATALDLPKARVHRHLTTLRDAGYLAQNLSTRRYEPGWRLILLGQRIEATAHVVTLARPIMTALRNAIGQTIVLSTLTSAGVTVTDVLPGGSPIDVILSPGTKFKYNSAAQGKVALAFGSPRQLQIWSRLIDEERTPSTVTDEARLWEEVAEIRKKGWASAPEETFRGVNALAAPVFSHNGQIAYTLAAVGSIHYLPDPPSPDIVGKVKEAAHAISIELGYQPSKQQHDTA